MARSGATPLRAGADVLLFLKQGNPDHRVPADRWTLRNVAHGLIDLRDRTVGVYGQDFTVLRDRDVILQRVRTAVAGPQPTAKEPSIGLEPTVFTPEGRMKRVTVPLGSRMHAAIAAGSDVFLLVPAP